MKQIIIISIFLLSSAYAYSQSNDPEIEDIYKSLAKLSMEFLTISYDSIKFKEGTTHDTIEILKQPDILFLKTTNLNPTPPYSYDKVVIKEKTYLLEQLFYDKDELFSVDKEEPVRFNYVAGYTFCFNMETYICLFFMNFMIPSSTPNFYILLSNLSQSDKRPILLGEQASFTPYCFGDFNDDGILDYLDWSYGHLYEPFMRFYSIEEDDFIIDKAYYINIEMDDKSTYSINKQASNWFQF
jgi:hypothetical protein